MDSELNECTFTPVTLKKYNLPARSYMESDERHHALQDYLDGNNSSSNQTAGSQFMPNGHRVNNSIRYFND